LLPTFSSRATSLLTDKHGLTNPSDAWMAPTPGVATVEVGVRVRGAEDVNQADAVGRGHPRRQGHVRRHRRREVVNP
jgi:hypothetical protein